MFFPIHPLSKNEIPIMHILKSGYVQFGGYFWCCKKEIVENFVRIYHEQLNILYKNGLTDDDQTIMYMCFIKKPSMFHIADSKGWHKAYKYLAK